MKNYLKSEVVLERRLLILGALIVVAGTLFWGPVGGKARTGLRRGNANHRHPSSPLQEVSGDGAAGGDGEHELGRRETEHKLPEKRHLWLIDFD